MVSFPDSPKDAATPEGEDDDMANGRWFSPQVTLGSIVSGAAGILAVGIAYQALKSTQQQQDAALTTVARRISANSAADTRRKNELVAKIHDLDKKLTDLIATLKERERHRITQQEFRELRSTLRALQLNSTNGGP